MSNSTRPPYDQELAATLSAIAAVAPLPRVESIDDLNKIREMSPSGFDYLEPHFEKHGLVRQDIKVAGPRGEVELTVIEPNDRPVDVPSAAIYVIHGGGMIMADRTNGLREFDFFRLARELNLVLVTVEYRLAPEHPAPAGVEDCYAGLRWLADNTSELNIDPNRIILAGGSGGGGLAAGTALLNRDHGGPELLAQLLVCPQLDDRHTTVSAYQYSKFNGGGETWARETSQFAWNLILGEGHEERDVSIYEAPARATDLSGLPQAFIDVGGAETFRDEDVAYASLLWASGVSAELHVWPGGFHGFEVFAPDAALSVVARQTRENWIRRVLAANS